MNDKHKNVGIYDIVVLRKERLFDRIDLTQIFNT